MSERRFEFPTIEPDAKAPTLRRLREMSRLLDKVVTIPGIRLHIGLDPIIGLMPIAGDFLGMLLSTYIVLEAARLGAPGPTLGRMALNVIVDGTVGSIPIFGDLFDFAWTANEYNIKLLEDYLKFPSRRKKADSWFILILLAGLLVFAIVLVAVAVIVIRLLLTALTGS